MLALAVVRQLLSVDGIRFHMIGRRTYQHPEPVFTRWRRSCSALAVLSRTYHCSTRRSSGFSTCADTTGRSRTKTRSRRSTICFPPQERYSATCWSRDDSATFPNPTIHCTHVVWPWMAVRTTHWFDLIWFLDFADTVVASAFIKNKFNLVHSPEMNCRATAGDILHRFTYGKRTMDSYLSVVFKNYRSHFYFKRLSFFVFFQTSSYIRISEKT